MTVRDRSIQELRERLAERFSEGEIQETLEYLEHMGYLDDLRFAANFVQYRNRQRPSGNFLLRFELRNKGIKESYIDQVLNTDEVEYELALNLARHRLSNSGDVDGMVRVRRLYALLERRGFPSNVARRVVGELLDRDLENDYN